MSAPSSGARYPGSPVPHELRVPGSPTRGANQYTSVSTLPLLRALLLRPRFRGVALPSNERLGLLGRLHETLDRRRLEALALTARKIARRNIGSRASDGKCSHQEISRHLRCGDFHKGLAILPYPTTIVCPRCCAIAITCFRYGGCKAPGHQRARTSTSTSTPVKTRKGRSYNLPSLRAIARYSPSARITRGKAPLASLITSPPGVRTVHCVLARASPP